MEPSSQQDQVRVVLLTTTRSYRNAAFLRAGAALDIEIVQIVDMPDKLAQKWEHGFSVDFGRLEEAVARISAFHHQQPIRAILPVDDSGSVLAARAGAAIGIPHNAAAAAEATRDKLAMRRALAGSGLNSPRFAVYNSDAQQEELEALVASVGFPCVVKPRHLNGSRGVIRADDLKQLQDALARSAALVRKQQGLPPDATVSLLVEAYIPGLEVALEGIVDNGKLQVLALFDKPDPLEGPFFEETIYVTPSRLPVETQQQIRNCAAAAAAQIGLQTGAVHAEFRLNENGPWILEIAGRSIGGLCSQVLQFGTEGSLEEIILRQACGLPYGHLGRAPGARGVMMIPIPSGGLLRKVDGLKSAQKTELISAVEITTPLDNPVTPLPEGDGYLGFIFARGPFPAAVEAALRQAHAKLQFKIDPLLPILPLSQSIVQQA